VLFPYIGKYRKLLTSYKFRKNTAIADFFAEKIIDLFSDTIFPELPDLKDAVIVPVPPRQGKIKENGWDQVDYLFKRFQKISNCFSSQEEFRCNFRRMLKRGKSKAQKNLSRAERMENLKGRIYLNTGLSMEETTAPIILLDDVITTGSTIDVCASVLKEAGAQKVYGICLYFD